MVDQPGASDSQKPFFDYGNGTYQDPMDPDAAIASQDAAAMSDTIASEEGLNTIQVSEMDE